MRKYAHVLSYISGLNIAALSSGLVGVVKLAQKVLLLAELTHLNVSRCVIPEEEILILSVLLAVAAELSVRS